jgi:DNA-binding HxlR family transcriptional regulator
VRAGRRSIDTGAPKASGAGRPGGAEDGLAAALEEVGDRWTLRVVDVLLDGPRRFNEVQSEVPGIATNVLAKRLLDLEQQGLVVASAYSARPPRFVYELTRGGHDLAAAVGMLRRWGARRHGGAGPTGHGPDHALCGTELEQRWWCPACDRAVEDDEMGPVRIV